MSTQKIENNTKQFALGIIPAQLDKFFFLLSPNKIRSSESISGRVGRSNSTFFSWSEKNGKSRPKRPITKKF